jgi:hypothetical protein
MTGGPIFVGGTGRSGTTIVGQLISQHPDVFRVVPTELRIFTDRRGLIDLLATVRASREPSLVRRLLRRPRRRRRAAGPTPEEFVDEFRSHWYGTVARDGTPRGLRLSGLELAAFEPLLAGFPDRVRKRPLEASRRFARDLIATLAPDAGRWVETTPGNAGRAPGLLELFPDLRLVHVVRDGRDTAASIATMIWGPHEIFEALAWWADRMHHAYAALERMPPERAFTIRLEDLLVRDRETNYERIRTGTDLAPDARMRAFFDATMTPERGHVGRWQSQLDDRDAAARFDRLYRQHLTRLRERFGPVPPTEDLDQPPLA